MATFQERFNILFDEADKSQEEFGKLFGASKSQVYNWRSGRGEPDTETMKKIAKACNVSVNWLIGDNNDRIPATALKAIDDPEVQEFMKTVVGEFRMDSNIPEKAKQEIMEDLAEYFKMKMNQAKRKAENK